MNIDSYNAFSPAVREDPYPHYAELRRSGVARVEPLGLWAVSRYDDVVFVLKNHELFSSAPLNHALLGGAQGRTLIGSDPPEHTRLRSIVNRAFTPRMVAELEPRIRQITEELIDAIAAGDGHFDLVEDLSVPVPVIVIAEILGIDSDRRHDFKRWSDDLVFSRSASFDPQEQSRLQESMGEFRSYFEDVLEERRRQPRQDLISALVRAEESERLTPAEVMAFTVLLLIAGNETTTNLIANAVLALLEHPTEMARVIADPGLVPNLVEEALRFDSPVQGLFRLATRDVELCGVTVPSGSIAMPLFASANRDERHFPEPDRFDAGRANAGDHVAFGYGPHFCLGAPLARLEGRVVLETLLRRLRGLERAAAGLDRLDSFFLRGLASLPLRFKTTARALGET